MLNCEETKEQKKQMVSKCINTNSLNFTKAIKFVFQLMFISHWGCRTSLYSQYNYSCCDLDFALGHVAISILT